MFIALYFFVLIISCLIGPAIYFQKNIPGYLKFFPPLFILTLIVEILEYWVAIKNNNNLLIYDSFWVFEISFFLFVIREIIEKAPIKRLIFWAAIIYPVLALFSILSIAG